RRVHRARARGRGPARRRRPRRPPPPSLILHQRTSRAGRGHARPASFVRHAAFLRNPAMRRTAPALLIAASSAIAGAGGDRPDVAIVAAASNTARPQTNTRFPDVRDKLLATGLFDSVSIFNATRFNPEGGTPSLDMLLQWDAVLVWSNDSFDDAVAMGDA